MSLRVEDIASYPINYFPPELIKDCCIIVCSISGTYADEIAYVKNYHTKGCKLIAITANEKSVLGVMSDVCVSYTLPLIMESDQNLTSQVPCCYIIELLASRTREILLRNNHSTTM
jgi:DNA-binding MurR/RpiR family transcriptional regulator